jgi:creatinine amidohydrolase/Fe(II)-dependent formamide hydrolase-like protein
MRLRTNLRALVTEKSENCKEIVNSEEDSAAINGGGIYTFPIEASKISNRVILGNTSSSSAEKGRALFDDICSQLLSVIREHMRV